MPCRVRSQRVSMQDEWVVETTCDEGFHRWLLVDLGGPVMVVLATGAGAPPRKYIPPDADDLGEWTATQPA